MKTALIAGATGLIGQSLLTQLLNSKHYHKIVALVRKPLNIEHPKLDIQVVDFNHISTFTYPDHVSDVFCCLGTTIKVAGSKDAFTRVDHTFVTDLARWAKNNNSQLFSVVSSVGAKQNTSNFYLSTKGNMEADVSSMELASVHIFRPSLLLGKREEVRFAEKISEVVMKIFQPVLIGSLRKYRAIKANEVALAMCKNAQSEEKGNLVFEGKQITAN